MTWLDFAVLCLGFINFLSISLQWPLTLMEFCFLSIFFGTSRTTQLTQLLKWYPMTSCRAHRCYSKAPDSYTKGPIVLKDVFERNSGGIFMVLKKDQIFWEHLLWAKYFMYIISFCLQHPFKVFIFNLHIQTRKLRFMAKATWRINDGARTSF